MKKQQHRHFPMITDLDSIPSPYTVEMLSSAGNRIVYFESSRGCPFSCSYCLSSTFDGVRYFSLERVKEDLGKLANAGVKQVKFVDRTFNCNKIRAMEIFKFIIGNFESVNFHFEAAADLFDDDMTDLLSKAPPGLIQFEIGVQTTNLQALEAINRRTGLEKVYTYVRRLRAFENIHLHLDLIAGLPYEDFTSFEKSFNDVYSLRPHQLQVGFLKMLKGSQIRREAELHGYSYREYPPYEILCNQYISFDQILELKGIEELVERYYNSRRFMNSLSYIIQEFFESPFHFFRIFRKFCDAKGFLDQALSGRGFYTVFMEFASEIISSADHGLISDLLKLDFLLCDNTNNLPQGIQREVESGFREKCFAFLKDDSKILQYIPKYAGTPAKQIFKQVHFEVFNHDVSGQLPERLLKPDRTVLLFDYSERDRVTGLYKYKRIDLIDF